MAEHRLYFDVGHLCIGFFFFSMFSFNLKNVLYCYGYNIFSENHHCSINLKVFHTVIYSTYDSVNSDDQLPFHHFIILPLHNFKPDVEI